MVKSTTFIKKKRNISKYPKLRAFLKRKDCYEPKRPSIFTTEQVKHFLIVALEETCLLVTTVVIWALQGHVALTSCANLLLRISSRKIVTIPYSEYGTIRLQLLLDQDVFIHLGITKKYIMIGL